jgi:hypothetical protein
MSDSQPSQSFAVTGNGNSFSNIRQIVNEVQAPADQATGEGESKVRPVKILFLAANPSQTAPLRLDQEVHAIDSALLSARLRDRFDLAQGWAVSAADLQDNLLRHEPDLVHLSGHGNTWGRLILEENVGMRNLAPPGAPVRDSAPSEEGSLRALGRLFAAAKGRIRCVVLNACHSAAQARVIAEHIDCVIGMTDSISDGSAIRFARAFYSSLGYGQSLQTAFDLGCAQIGLERPEEERIPRLLAPRCDPARLALVRTAG